MIKQSDSKKNLTQFNTTGMFWNSSNTMGLKLTTKNNTTAKDAHTCAIRLSYTEGSIVLMALATGILEGAASLIVCVTHSGSMGA